MSVLKRLKRILRRYRGILVIGGLLLVIISSIMWGYTSLQADIEQNNKRSKEVESIDVMGTTPVELVLETRYLCGTETEVKEFDNIRAMEIWLQNEADAWELVEKQGTSFKMVRQVEDELSPLCKNEGYFGLSEDGRLTLFQGPPIENQVIESFFRLDTELLNVSLPQDELQLLSQGIRVKSVAEYLSILSTYGHYATEY